MVLMFLSASRWREDTEPAVPRARDRAGAAARAVAAPGARRRARRVVVAIGAGGWLVASARHDPRTAERRARARRGRTDGWQSAARLSDWRPDIYGASGTLRQTFAKDGVPVGLTSRYYRDQTREPRLISSRNRLVQPDNTRWVRVEQRQRATLDAGGQPLPVRAARICRRRRQARRLPVVLGRRRHHRERHRGDALSGARAAARARRRRRLGDRVRTPSEDGDPPRDALVGDFIADDGAGDGPHVRAGGGRP